MRWSFVRNHSSMLERMGIFGRSTVRIRATRSGGDCRAQGGIPSPTAGAVATRRSRAWGERRRKANTARAMAPYSDTAV
jgi:hypothetical protein